MFAHYPIINLLWNIFWLLAPVFIYLDATGHLIGRIKGDKSFVNMAAGAWAAMTLLIGIIGLPFLFIFAKQIN